MFEGHVYEFTYGFESHRSHQLSIIKMTYKKPQSINLLSWFSFYTKLTEKCDKFTYNIYTKSRYNDKITLEQVYYKEVV